jgi:hypothetical protein
MDYGYSKNLPKKDSRQSLYKKQREERGFDDTETWALDATIAKFVLPRLKRFKELHICHPSSITMEEWDCIIQQMIDGFEEALLRDEKIVDWDYEKVNTGLKLFVEYYHDLWW